VRKSATGPCVVALLAVVTVPALTQTIAILNRDSQVITSKRSGDACNDPDGLHGLLAHRDTVPNLLTNPGFEEGNNDWDSIPGRDLPVTFVIGDSEPRTGSGFAGALGCLTKTERGASQTVSVDDANMCGPGEYDLTLSGWLWVHYANVTNPSYESCVELQLWVDGEDQTGTRLSSLDHPDPPVGTKANGSYYTYHVTAWSGTVNTSVEARLLLTADGRDGRSGVPIPNWGVVLGDDLWLTAHFRVCPHDPVFDFDDDGDVDQDNFGVMQACISGPGSGLRPGADCACADWDDDLDVDDADLEAFDACASGPAITADPTCDDPEADRLLMVCNLTETLSTNMLAKRAHVSP